MIYGTVSNVVLVHHIHYAHNDFGIMSGITVNLHVEDVSAAGQVMIGGFDFSFMAGTAFIVHRNVVGIGVVITICNAWQATEFLAVYAGELARQTFGRSSQYTIIMLILIRELVSSGKH